MFCPKCQIKLTEIQYHGIVLNRCDNCSGVWFDKDELRKTKDREDEFLKWLDIDVWKDHGKIKMRKSDRICPINSEPLFVTSYGDSGIEIDVCGEGKGIWLDKGEYEKIISYLKETVNTETLKNYLKDIGKEALEIFLAKEGIVSEAGDFLIVAKLFWYRILAKWPQILRIISKLPT